MIVEPVAWMEPVEAAARLRRLGGLAFLDSAMCHSELGRYSYVAADPFAIFSVTGGQAAWQGRVLGGAPLDALRDVIDTLATPRRAGLPPFQGGAIGTLDYPAGPDGAWPDARLSFFDVVVAFDHVRHAAWLISSGLPDARPAERERRAGERARLIRDHLAGPAPEPPPAAAAVRAIGRARWRSNFTRESYRAAVASVVEAILDGEIFQANIAQRFAADLPPGFDRWSFYRRLRQANPAPFAAFLDQGSRVIASSSPELLVRADAGAVETRPIKGTARRDGEDRADRIAAARLLASEKDRAENIMIVDLLRNDLSRVCRPHSVKTPSLCVIESYAGLHHLVSVVTGELAPGQTALDALAACFPGGSVTGAPKDQARRVIARVENTPRDVYCGSVAWVGLDGAVSANIAIRTVTFADNQAVFQAGGGVTALSDPDAEYQETLDKAAPIFAAFEEAAAEPEPR